MANLISSLSRVKRGYWVRRTGRAQMANQNSGSDAKTILVVEDNVDSREMLRMFLEKAGYNVQEAENGRDAIDLAREVHPDLVMIDLNLPVMDGISAAREIRQLEGLRNVPIIANSASGSHGIGFFQNIESLGEGFVEYLPKPFNFAYLIDLINTLLPRESNV